MKTRPKAPWYVDHPDEHACRTCPHCKDGEHCTHPIVKKKAYVAYWVNQSPWPRPQRPPWCPFDRPDLHDIKPGDYVGKVEPPISDPLEQCRSCRNKLSCPFHVREATPPIPCPYYRSLPAA